MADALAIAPPDGTPTPKWARMLVQAANSRNSARGSSERFTLADLVAIWNDCEGRCAVSKQPFDGLIVGDGKAKRPFYPSLDRIDRHRPYVRDNVRLVVSVANFAMNAWGLEPLKQLAAAFSGGDVPIAGKSGRPRGRPPSDGDYHQLAVRIPGPLWRSICAAARLSKITATEEIRTRLEASFARQATDDPVAALDVLRRAVLPAEPSAIPIKGPRPKKAKPATQAELLARELGFPARETIRDGVEELLVSGPHSSRDIEDSLAKRFQISRRDRQVKLQSGCPVWRNQVAWALADLVQDDAVTRLRTERAADGGTTGIYRSQSA